ncbi:MAG: gliding motility lipoprotein GldH [Dysgonomonas sp.]
MRKIFGVILCATMFFGFFSCGRKEAYYQFSEIKSSKWHKSDTLRFVIDSTLIDNRIPYNVFIDITNDGDYPYRNIWFYVEDNISDTAFSFNPKQYMLADEFGKWYGSGFGTQYQMSLIYEDSLYFTGRRNYEIKIVHGMRDEPLSGIEKVGIRIEKAIK